MSTFLTAEGLARMLQKVKAVFATKTELAAQAEASDASCVHKTGNETVAGAKTLTGNLTSKVVNGPAYKIVNTGITKGSDSISGWTYIPFVDSSEAESNQQGRLGYIGFNYNKKANTGCLVAYNGTTATSLSSL